MTESRGVEGLAGGARPVVPPGELKGLVEDVLPGITAFRHALHRIPELKFNEYETADAIRSRLRGGRLECLPPLLETDVVGLLHGRAPGPCVLLRADMDGLPIEETTGRPYASVRAGRSHACGHDGHVAMLAGAAEVLERLAPRFEGSVRFVFQPAEEEGGGGRDLVAAGLLDLVPRPVAAYALHGWPGLPAGCVASREGYMMAAADRFTIRLIGRGGHGAAPHQTVDPIVLAGQVIAGLQTIASRLTNPLEPVVVSLGIIHGGTAANIIPDEVYLKGTTRYFDKALRRPLAESIERLLGGITQAAGARYEWTYKDGYIPLVNHPRQVNFARDVVRTYTGEKAWMYLEKPNMVAEDFSFYLDAVPGAMLFIGLGEDHPRLHGAGFDFNDRVLGDGIRTLAALALETLRATQHERPEQK